MLLHMTETQFLTADQLAERWQIAARSVRDMAAAQEIPAMRLGKLWRFPLADLVDFEQAAMVGVEPVA